MASERARRANRLTTYLTAVMAVTFTLVAKLDGLTDSVIETLHVDLARMRTLA